MFEIKHGENGKNLNNNNQFKLIHKASNVNGGIKNKTLTNKNTF